MTHRRVSSRRKVHLALAAFACSVSVAVGADREGEQFLDSIQQQVLSIFEKCRGAVARIEATDVDGKLFGTGFFIDPSGTLYTSYSIGGETRDIVVTLGEAKYPATRLIGDMRSGVAILKVDAQTPFLTFATPGALRIASPVVAIGYPMDLPVTPTFGIVGGFDIKYLGRYFATSHIRANVPVQRGEGGAPLLNLRGEVVGLLISSLDNGSASFVLPIEAAEKVRRDYVRFHEVRPGWMGIVVGPPGTESPRPGAQIDTLVKDSPGEKAGLHPGDLLVQVGAHKIASNEDVLDASYFLTAEDELTLTVLRGEERLAIKVQPIDHPQLHRQPPPAIDFPNGLPLPSMKAEK